MQDKVMECFYSVCYDLPVGKHWKDMTKEEKETENMKWYLARWLRGRLKQVAARINLSVFVFEKRNYERVQKIVDDAFKKYAGINEHPEIYILRYHGASNDILKENAIKALTKELNAILKQMDKLQEQLSKNIKPLSQKRKAKIAGIIKDVHELSKTLGVDKDMQQLMGFAQAKLRELI